MRQRRGDAAVSEAVAASMLTCFRCDQALRKTVIDCPVSRALAEFYCQVLGMRVNEDIDGWVVIGSGPGRASWLPAGHRMGSAALA